jgi:CO dehydrogenase/acetyl-CoA synthase beta subunit
MKIEEIFKRLRSYTDSLVQDGVELSLYEKKIDFDNYLESFQINVELNKHKAIILQDETGLELGGINKKSFSLVYPINSSKFKDYLRNGQITLIGPEIEKIVDSSVNFGMIIFIGGCRITENVINSLKHFNFVSNGIEGFLIRSIPRKFWCRISSKIIKRGFSFQLLGNAFFYLYEQKYGNLIESMEILFINTYSNIIDEYLSLSSKLRDHMNESWIRKIENWSKRIDCEYDWGCEMCPYQEECYEIKQVLIEREKIDK